jgi:hypothetical protein
MMSEWQPIETAPKDGKDILVWAVTRLGTGYYGIAHWHRGASDYWAIESDDQEVRGDDIKAWTPLPAPPNT